ncbi:MAG: U32 family peptidase [Candidatus Magasanikbacteria bacterium]|nr:U32 family peptidase [Candidatus Magasanikbacteria bacterium]
MNRTKIELLAPAGSIEKMRYAFAYGADAVYMGIPDFSLRVRINNFTLDTVEQAIKEAHDLGKKIYVTINIYAHNEHLKNLPDYLKKLKKMKPDAFIISDPGVMQFAKKYAGQIPIHVSTQANVTNWSAAKFWHSQGVERVILGREVSIEEIKEIHEKVPELELEHFIHGAMCMSYSGRCMLSSWLTGRSANLGDCAQPCRWKYSPQLAEHHVLSAEVEEPLRPGVKIPVEEDKNGTYIFNSKDMCMIEYLPEMIETGLVSFKIEGRAKSPAYLASVVKAYRQAFDMLEGEIDKKKAKKKLKKIKKEILDKLVHRGYTTGFAFGKESVEQNIDNSHIGGEEQFVGEVLNCKKHDKNYLVKIRPHNAIKLGDELRIMRPKSEDVRLTIKNMYNEKGEEIESGHGGAGKNVVLELDRGVEEFGIVFKNLEL